MLAARENNAESPIIVLILSHYCCFVFEVKVCVCVQKTHRQKYLISQENLKHYKGHGQSCYLTQKNSGQSCQWMNKWYLHHSSSNKSNFLGLNLDSCCYSLDMVSLCALEVYVLEVWPPIW
jgi:hypothetical protein